MRMLLLLPNFVLLAISGYNLYNNVTTGNFVGSLAVNLLKLLVMALCFVFTAIIVKSMFTVKYIANPDATIAEDDIYKNIVLRHSL